MLQLSFPMIPQHGTFYVSHIPGLLIVTILIIISFIVILCRMHLMVINRSRSLEALPSLAVWSPTVEQILLIKGEKGLGFSILDYQVS